MTINSNLFRKKIVAGLLLILAISSCKPVKTKMPLIDNQVVFLYYENIADAAYFYENILGFDKSYDDSWVKIYNSRNGSAVGLVDILKTGYDTTAEKQVMVSFQVSNIKGWYSYLKSRNVHFEKPLQEEQNAPISAFLIKDPGGYQIEFFKWKQ